MAAQNAGHLTNSNTGWLALYVSAAKCSTHVPSMSENVCLHNMPNINCCVYIQLNPFDIDVGFYDINITVNNVA